MNDIPSTKTDASSIRAARRKRRRRKLLIRRCIFLLLFLIILFILGTLISRVIIPSVTSRKPNHTASSVEPTVKKDTRSSEIMKNKDKYPSDLLELLSKNPETLDFVFNYPTAKDQPCADTIGEIVSGEIPLLLQWDERWGYGTYGDNMIAINGCGPTTLAMVAVGLTGDTSITPYKVAQYSAENGYYVPDSGTSWELMKSGCQAFGISSRELPLNETTMANELSSGHPIICSMRPGDFTTTGHFIVLTGYQDGQFKVNDPNSKARSEKLWDYEQLSYQINNLWAFSAL